MCQPISQLVTFVQETHIMPYTNIVITLDGSQTLLKRALKRKLGMLRYFDTGINIQDLVPCFRSTTITTV